MSHHRYRNGNSSTAAEESTDPRLSDYFRDLEVLVDTGATFTKLPEDILGALEIGRGGAILKALGYDEDIRTAARVDQFALVPELRRDPLRVEVGAVGIVKCHWRK